MSSERFFTVVEWHRERNDNYALLALLLLVFSLFMGNLITRTYPIDPFWVEIAQTHMPLKTFYRRALFDGYFPLWNPHISLGYPTPAHSHSFIFYPFAWFFYLFDFMPAMTVFMISQLILMVFSMYVLMRSWGFSVTASFLSAGSLSCGGYALTSMGYHPVFSTYIWTPLTILFITKLLVRAQLKSILGLVFVTATQSLAGDMEMVFYQWLYISLWLLLTVLLNRNDFKNKIISIFSIYLSAGAGCLLATIQLLPLLELFSQSDRSASVFAIPMKNALVGSAIEYALTFLRLVFRLPAVAHFFNLGVIVLVFGVIGFLKSDKKTRLLLGILLLFSFIACAQNYSLLFRLFSYLPIVKGFRFPWRFLFLVQFTAILISAIGIDYFLRSSTITSLRNIALIALFYGVISTALSLITEKSPMGGFLVSVVALLSLLAFQRRKTLTSRALIAFIFFIFVGDFLVPSMIAMPRNKGDVMEPYPEVKKFYDDNQNGEYAYSRSISFCNDLDPRFITGMEVAWGGYSPVIPFSLFTKRYSRFFSLIVPEAFGFDASSQVLIADRPFYYYFFQKYRLPKESLPFLNLAGVRYVLVKRGALGNDQPLFEGDSPVFKLWRDDKIEIYESASAYERTFLVENAKFFSHYNDVFRFMRENSSLDLRHTLLLEAPSELERQVTDTNEDKLGETKIVSYKPDMVEIKVSSQSDGWLFLSDSYYPGWRAQIDFEETKIYPAYGALRAIRIPPGEHDVKFIYSPLGFRVGLWFAIASWLFFFVMMGRRMESRS